MPLFRIIAAAAATRGHVAIAAPSIAADACAYRGELDAMYCDANKDLVADVPTDTKKWKDPSTIVFTYTPVEDPAVYENIFKPFGLPRQMPGQKVVFTRCNRTLARSRRCAPVVCTSRASRPVRTAFAVNLAGRDSVRGQGHREGFQGYNLIVIVKANSPYKTLADLKGKKVAHTSPSSNSGHLAPLALFPKEGLTPDKDYKIIFSGKHDQSVMGVNSGDYDAGAVASDVFHRMAERGRVKEADFRIIVARNSRRRRSRMRMTSRRSSPTRCCRAFTTTASSGNEKRSTAPIALPDQLQDDVGSACATSHRDRVRASTGVVRQKRRAKKRKPRRRRNSGWHRLVGLAATSSPTTLAAPRAEQTPDLFARRQDGHAGRLMPSS